MWTRFTTQARWALPVALLLAYGAEQFQSALLAVLTPACLLIYVRAGSWWRQCHVWILLSLLWALAFGQLAPFLQPAEWAVSVTAAVFMAQWPFVIDRFLHKRVPFALSSLVLPVALVSNDFLRHLIDPTGSYGLLGYSVGADSVLAPWASVLGIDGISFLLAWSAAGIATVFTSRARWPSYRVIALAYATTMLVVITYGLIYPHTSAPRSTSVTLALIANGNTQSRDLTWWLQQSENAAARGAQWIVWGEGALMIPQREENAALEKIQTLAQNTGTHIVAGIFHSDQVFQGKRHNKLVWIDNEGRVRSSYHKNHGQFAEGTVESDGMMNVVETPWGRVGLSICWDADFPRFMRQAGDKSVQAIINPSYDFAGVAHARADIARFRAIENGVTIIRPNNFGWSFIANQHGQLLSQQWLNRGDTSMQLYTLPLTAQTTIYRFVGDGFLWSCVAALLLLLVLGFRRDLAERNSITAASGVSS